MLPKFAVLSSDFRCSCGSVTQAVHQLASRGVLHRVGRSWVVVPQHQTHRVTGAALVHDEALVIILVLDRTHQWAGMFRSARTRSFVTSFVAEQERYGVKMITVFTDSQARKSPPGSPAGLDSLCALAKSLGSRHPGTLFLSYASYFVEISPWVDTILKFKKPVVWLDQHSEAPPPQAVASGTRLSRGTEERRDSATA